MSVRLCIQYKKLINDVDCIIVEVKSKPLFDLKTCTEFNLIRRVREKTTSAQFLI